MCVLTDTITQVSQSVSHVWVLFIFRSPTASSKDPYEAFNLPMSKRSMDSPPVIPPRLSPESSQPPPTARALVFSDSLIARLSQDPNLARFLKSSSVDQPNNNRQQLEQQQQQQQRASSLFQRRISAEGLQLRR